MGQLSVHTGYGLSIPRNGTSDENKPAVSLDSPRPTITIVPACYYLVIKETACESIG